MAVVINDGLIRRVSVVKPAGLLGLEQKVIMDE
jgi:hypothetical protein